MKSCVICDRQKPFHELQRVDNFVCKDIQDCRDYNYPEREAEVVSDEDVYVVISDYGGWELGWVRPKTI